MVTRPRELPSRVSNYETTHDAAKRIDLIISGRLKDQGIQSSYGTQSSLNGRPFSVRPRTGKEHND